jgi:hypothetical protein
LAQQLARDRAAYGRVQVRGAPALWFDGGEVLHIPAGGAAEVLPEEGTRPVRAFIIRPFGTKSGVDFETAASSAGRSW